MTASDSQDDIDLFAALHELYRLYWMYPSDTTVSRLVVRIRQPLAELVNSCIAFLIDEIQSNSSNPHVQASGLHLLLKIITQNALAKAVVSRHGGDQALLRSIQEHVAAEDVLAEALAVVDEFHGLCGLLQAMRGLRHSAAGVRVALRLLLHACEARWPDIEQLCPQDLVSSLLIAATSHPQDEQVLESVLSILFDVLSFEATRRSFAAASGWEWFLSAVEPRMANVEVQRGCAKVLVQLCKGGASVHPIYLQRASDLVGRALTQHDQDATLLRWGVWAVQQLNGAQALVAALRCQVLGVDAVASVLRSLSGIDWGNSITTGPGEARAVASAAAQTMGKHRDQPEILCEASHLLSVVAVFAVCGGFSDVGVLSVEALLELMPACLADAEIVQAALQAVGEIIDGCPADSAVMLAARNGLFRCEAPLLHRISLAHATNQKLQAIVMWISGVTHGVCAIVRLMAEHPGNEEVQFPALKALAEIFGNRIDLDEVNAASRRTALQHVIAALSGSSHTNLVFKQHACYTLTTIAEHGLGAGVDEAALVTCLMAAVECLLLVRGRCDNDSTSYNVLYLRQEATRLVVTLCSAAPSLRQALREGPEGVLVDAAVATASGLRDGRRDAEAEEVLRLELLALAFTARGSPAEPLVEALRRWGRAKPAVARAVADAVVELLRTTPAATQALRQGGCCEELLTAIEAHPSDEDLQGRLQLAIGFLASPD